MTTNLIWQQHSSDPQNVDNLAAIARWWSGLNGKEIIWQQRLIPETNNLAEINWEPQRFDEKFMLSTPQLRGITVYWHKDNAAEERDITAKKLELDRIKQKLYIYPQTQSVIICVTFPQIVYRTIELNYPQIAGSSKGDDYLLLLRDDEQKLEIKVTLNKQKLQQFLEKN
jgi:hypothetical protein